MHRLLITAALVACEPFGPGGDPPEPPRGEGQLYIDTDSLDFGAISVQDDEFPVLELRVRNSGTGLLKVVGLNHPLGDEEAFKTNAPPLLELTPNESFTVSVEFLPQSSEDYNATLLPNGLFEIALSGTGLAPQLTTSPQDLHFESQPIGCNQQQQLVLENRGEEPLHLEHIGVSGSPAFVVDSEFPLTLEPGEQSTSIVVFSPSTGGMHSSVLAIESNDPIHPTTVFPLAAIGFEGEEVHETHAYHPTGRADILFLLNERLSVRNHLSTTTEALEDFLTELQGLDWRIAASNMSATCTLGPTPWLDSSDAMDTSSTALYNAFWMAGSGGTSLFDKASLLLERTDPGDCFDGFLRENSLLQLAFITDQPETSTGSVTGHLEALTNQLSENQSLVISSLSGKDYGSCSNSPRLAEAVEDTNGSHHDLCNNNLENFLLDLSSRARDQIDQSVSFALQELPVVSTLSLRHGNQLLHSWQYLSSGNRIVLDGEANELHEGAEIEVDYLAAVACE